MIGIIIVLVGIVLCLGAFALIELGIGDSFISWFERTCMERTFVDVNGAGLIYGYRTIDWESVREFLIPIACGSVAIGFAIMVVLCLVFYHVGKRRSVEQVEAVIDDVAQQESAHVERYPRAFASIVARIGELEVNLQRREQTAKDENDRRNELITYLAHDLKTPLASIVGYLNLLVDTPEMAEGQRAKCLKITLDKANQLEELIEEFFDVARYTLQEIELQCAPVDLDFMLIQLTDEFKPLFFAHDNTVEVSCPPGLTLYADAERLARVFNNILKNAIAYSYEGTLIVIAVSSTESSVCIEFRSTGDTIPASKLSLIFEKFYRVDEARSGSTGGAGLGLAIANEIVELHGGTISATSENGLTTFSVTLPLQPELEGPEPEAASEKQPALASKEA